MEADGQLAGQTSAGGGHKGKRARARTRRMPLNGGDKSAASAKEGNKCDSGQEPSGQAQPEVRCSVSGSQDQSRGANIYENPLISISMVAGSRQRSRTSCASSLWSLRSQSAIDELEASGTETEAADHERGSMLALNRNNSAQSSGRWDSLAKGRADRDSAGSAVSLAGLDAVKCSYTKLINYNKLQCFYLGALLYSLSSVAFLLKTIFGAEEEASSGTWQWTNLRSSNETRPTGRTLEAPSCGRLDTQSACRLLAALVPLTLVLLLLIVIKLIGFNLTESDPTGAQHEQQVDRHRKRLVLCRASLLRSFHKCLGVALSVALLILPTSFIYLTTFSDRCPPDPMAPMILLAALVYVLPSALAGLPKARPTSERHRFGGPTLWSYLACAAILLPFIWIVFSKYQQFSAEQMRTLGHTPAQVLRLVLLIVAVTLLCGQLRRQLLVRLASGSIFEGASELIDAKVSLEQQRQQQETLLLSVLPAYVAEQVKRNMVKKMESLEEQQLAGGLEPASAAANHYHHVLVGTTNASTQTFGLPQVRSLTLPVVASEDGAPEAASRSPRSRAAAARQRNSFVTFSRLSTSLASGAVFLSESLLNRNAKRTCNSKSLCEHHNVSTGTQACVSTSAANSSSQLTSLHQVPSQSSCLAPLSALPPAGGSLQQQQSRRGFNELYIRTYNNVSLLYGDIVGFTSLCTQLSSSQLVRVLNNLFSYFDHLADQHKIMRIKILGDCYYGVSGIPEFAVMGAKSAAGPAKKNKAGRQASSQHQNQADNHAINCVNMGLDMIKYIKCLNIEREQHCCHSGSSSDHQLAAPASGARASGRAGAVGILAPGGREHSLLCSRQHSAAGGAKPQLPAHFELNMRIGIHTGHIHSGVIGLKKWQFDVWSNDVSIAMHCESSGVAGRVQVTEATVQHLNQAFTFEPAPSTTGPHNVRDSFLVDRDIRTYLIKDRVEPASSSPDGDNDNDNDNKLNVNLDTLDRKWPSGSSATGHQQHAEDGAAMGEDKIRAATIGTIRQTLLSAEMPGASSTSALALALEHNDLEWLSLRFRDAHQEQQYLEHPISLARLMREHLQLLLLIGILWLLDLGLSSSETGPGARDSAIILALASLLLAILAARLLRHSTRKSSNGCNSRDTPDLAPPSLPQLVELAQSCEMKASKFRWTLWWRRALCDNRLANYFRRSRLLERETALRVAQSGLSHYLSLLIFATITAGQVYHIGNEFCSGVPSARLNALYQISALVLLMALDLSAVSLSHQLKSTLIVLIALAQLVSLASTPLAQQHQAGLLCLLLGRVSPKLKSQLEANSAAETGSAQSVLFWFNDLLLLVLSLWSFGYARKLDYSNRCNFLWRNRLNVDHEELEYISGINKVLLENILPSHVVQHYLSAAHSSQQAPGPNASQSAQPVAMTSQTSSRDASGGHRLRHQVNERRHSNRRLVRMSIGNMQRYLSHEHELYHEQHDSVAVMFASIPHFYEFYDESDISKQGLGCIALLNEIICDFDKLLLKNKFSRIEKIKTIGSTYMAAAGLRPNPVAHAPVSARASTSSSQVQSFARAPNSRATSSAELSGQLSAERAAVKLMADNQQTRMNLICMIQFASSLMSALNGINKQSFQVFKLRVGVNTGPVIAGIIGAQRPFYDIWGDCVNIASRMESLGEIGRIQVEERTAKLLLECLCTETYQIEKRGHIDVKGKGGMVTYFVDKRQPAQQAPSLDQQSSLQQQQQQQQLSGGEPARDAITLESSYESPDKQQKQEQRRLGPEQQVAAAACSASPQAGALKSSGQQEHHEDESANG